MCDCRRKVEIPETIDDDYLSDLEDDDDRRMNWTDIHEWVRLPAKKREINWTLMSSPKIFSIQLFQMCTRSYRKRQMFRSCIQIMIDQKKDYANMNNRCKYTNSSGAWSP